MKYGVGDTVPDFEMESTDGSVFRLSDAAAKNPVLMWVTSGSTAPTT